MGRKKLIFFVTADPARDAAPVAAAYELARVAATADIAAEVRLAADAVLVADPAYLATTSRSAALRERVDSAVQDRIEVSVCPRSVDARGIRDDQITAIGAQRRPLADILVEVAEGGSILVPV